VRYINEQPPGSLIKVESAVTKIGNKSATVLHRMTNTETDQVAATSEIALVYFDLKERTSMAIPDDLRARMQPYLIDASDLA
jgi:acyl-CoA thioester hydrolase